MQPVYVFDTTAEDKLSKVRGVGRYLQLLRENFSDDFKFTSQLPSIPRESTLINPFFDFVKPPLALRRLAKKQVGVIHDVIRLKHPSHFPVGVKGKVNMYFNILTINNYDVLITVSEHSKRDIVEICNIPEERVKVVYQTLSKSFYNSNSKPSAGEQNSKLVTQLIEQNARYCLYVGDVTWNKNLVNLAKAIKLINVTCVFVGKVFENRDPTTLTHLEQQEYREFLREVGNDKRFIFAGYVKDEELISLYTHARCNVLVSRDEGFGLSYLEASHLATPSILSNISVFEEIAQDTALFADPSDINAIANQIGELYFNEDTRNKLGQKAKKHSQRFSPIHFKKSLLEAIMI